MLTLFAVFALLLMAGSLYPWILQPGPDFGAAAWHVLTSWQESMHSTGVRDIAVNLVVYVPLGFTGFLWKGWRAAWRAGAYPC